MDRVVEKLDEIGKPAWIGLMVLSFVLFWPIGLALLAFLIWSGRMGHKRHRSCAGRWRFEPRDASSSSRHYNDTSGNRAFDEYREETLKRLEQEQAEFFEFLERLRFAKDKSEFDQFLSERRQEMEPTQPQPEA